MKKLYTILLVIFLILVIAVGAVAALAFGFYHMYLKPQPAQFEYSQDISAIKSVNIVQVEKVGEDKFNFIPVTEIKDVDVFLTDFEKLECTKGLSIETFSKLADIDGLSAIMITYSDDNFDVITPYGNIDSTIFTPDITLDTVLNEKFFFFDRNEFDGFIKKYYKQ